MSLKRSRYRSTGPTARAVDLVLSRDMQCCVVCGQPAHGIHGQDWSIQHRVRRGAGGTLRPWINLPSNLILLHGSGTTGCHGEVEANPAWAEEYGWRVKDGITLPSQATVWHVPLGLWVCLDDDGGWAETVPGGAT